jgi:hypothetical protein
VSVELVALVALAGIVAGIGLAILSVARLVRVTRQAEMARAPVAAATAVAFPEAGAAELAVEGPRFTTRFRNLSFELVDPTGLPVTLHRLWIRTASSGVSRVRLSLHRLELPHAGTYQLRIAGLDADADYSGCAIVFVRPQGPGLAATIVGLLASIGLAAASFAVAGALLFQGSPHDPPTPEPTAAPPAVIEVPDAMGGRRLRADSARIASGLDVDWPTLRMRVRVPADWVVRKVGATELDLRHPTTPSTFVVAHASPMPSGPRFDDYLRAHVQHARERLGMRLIEGYATRRLGAVPGVLTFEQRTDGAAWMVTWAGFQPAEGGSIAVTILLGAADEDFARDEALLGAIVDSIRFE